MNSGATAVEWGTGGQIAFPATAVPSSDANTLDDYEEGTWTPDLQFGDAKVGVTYGTQEGTYTKIGRQVTLNCGIVLTSKGSSTGVTTVKGAPFTAGNTYNICICRLGGVAFANVFIANLATSTIYLEEATEAGVISNLSHADFTDTSTIFLNVTYLL